MPYVLGLTGGIASGKSLLAERLQTRGALSIDTDQIAHTLTAPGGLAIGAITQAFGATMIQPDGALDRAAMRARVFGETEARLRLEGILHPLIGNEVRAALAAATACYVVLSVPLLFESKRMLPLCDRTLVVDIPEPLQLQRLLARPGITLAIAQRVIAAQAPRIARLSRADDVLENTGTRAHLDRRAGLIDAQIRQRARISGKTSRAAAA
jgi:dephospho-CoA kinase